jgi:hypothetical protein
VEKPVFKIYQKEFVCDRCGELTFMGIIGFSEKYFRVCDLCLINEVDAEPDDSIHPSNSKPYNQDFTPPPHFLN